MLLLIRKQALNDWIFLKSLINKLKLMRVQSKLKGVRKALCQLMLSTNCKGYQFPEHVNMSKDNNENQVSKLLFSYQYRIQREINKIPQEIYKYNLIMQSAQPKLPDLESVDEFKSHLNLIKSMTGDKAQEQFYLLMEKAKNILGQLNISMGEFYFEYAKFLLEKMEKNIDVFNSNMLPAQKQEQKQNYLEEVLEDDSSLQENSQKPKSENNVNVHCQSQQNNSQEKKVQNEHQPNNQPQITENQEQKGSIIVQNKNQQQKEGAEAQVPQAPAQDDDFQVCADNLLCAVKIFQNERDRIQQGGQQQKYTLPELLRWISRCKSRLGDLYHLCQNYQDAVSVYREVIQEEQKKQDHQSNRGLAQIHYMIANSFLYENKEGCQKIAIQQFIKSVQILLKHLLTINPQDTANYEAPTQIKIKVDRFPYLPNSLDGPQVKQIKEVISCLLDKIQDTYEQIAIRAEYEAQKRKNKKQEQQNKFKQVSPEVPVIKLGTFGNRKKKAQQLPDEELKKKK